jgi:hypothetical protein
MTDHTDRQTTTDDENRRMMKDVDHTHPDTDEAFGDSGIYDRGGADDGDRIRSDGGEPPEGPERRSRTHTPAKGMGAQRAFDRGPSPSGEGS